MRINLLAVVSQWAAYCQISHSQVKFVFKFIQRFLVTLRLGLKIVPSQQVRLPFEFIRMVMAMQWLVVKHRKAEFLFVDLDFKQVVQQVRWFVQTKMADC